MVFVPGLSSTKELRGVNRCLLALNDGVEDCLDVVDVVSHYWVAPAVVADGSCGN